MSQFPRLGGVSSIEAELELVDIARRDRAALAAAGILGGVLNIDPDDPLVSVDLWRSRAAIEGDLRPLEEGGLHIARTRLVEGQVRVDTTQETVYLADGLTVIPRLAYSQQQADLVRDLAVRSESIRARLRSAGPVSFRRLPGHISRWSAQQRNR